MSKDKRPSLKIDWATHEAAKFACQNWHYSKCLPSSLQKRFAVGAWEDEKFIGVVVFGHGANLSIGVPYGLTIYQCCELTRVALRRGHKTEVSKIIKIAILFLKKANPKIRLIVSYADAGQGHHGGIYQAGNWLYCGISKSANQLKFNKKIWHPKALKTSYPNISHSDPRVEKIPGTDKHKYLMPLDDLMRRQIEPLRKPYPKRASSKEIVASDFQSEEGGENPTEALQ